MNKSFLFPFYWLSRVLKKRRILLTRKINRGGKKTPEIVYKNHQEASDVGN
jgi:hypothetical protein